MPETQSAVSEYEVRTEDVSAEPDFFNDEGDAQEWAVRMARQGHTPTVHRRVSVVTIVTGEWLQIPTITPEEADAEVPSWARDSFDVLDAPVAAGKAGDTE